MDKMSLTSEQLKELKFYIYKRGFREDVIQNEILDHFACKVEEKMTANKNMNLEQAMHEAHNEFGYSGFYSIKAALEVFTRKRYKRVYWAEVKHIVTSPLMLVILLLGWISYKGIVWAAVNHIEGITGYNATMDALFALVVISMVIKYILSRKIKANFFTDIARSMGTWVFIPCYLWMGASSNITERRFLVESIITVVLFVTYLIGYIADYRRLKIAETDYKEFEILEV